MDQHPIVLLTVKHKRTDVCEEMEVLFQCITPLGLHDNTKIGVGLCFHKQNPVITACGKKQTPITALQTHHCHKVLINFSIITKQGCCPIVSEWKTQPKPPTMHCKGAGFHWDLKLVGRAERACTQPDARACRCCSLALANIGTRIPCTPA